MLVHVGYDDAMLSVAQDLPVGDMGDKHEWFAPKEAGGQEWWITVEEES